MENNRDKQIIKVSITGILANVLLAGFKTAVGIFSNSIAIVLDAVNNISDAASSLITIIGTKLASKEADRKHPFGYGRTEYISALLIAGLVLYAGLTSLVESVKKILEPGIPEYNTAGLIIVASAVAVKILLGLYVKKNGENLNSDSLVNSGKDALLDSLISASTLIAAFIQIFSGISIEAWLGTVISLVIIKSGIEMLSETLSKILGEPGDIMLLKDISAEVESYPEVLGSYDLVLHDYGPDRHLGSVHIEVDEGLSVRDVDELTRKITVSVYKKLNVLLTAISIYSVNTKDIESLKIKNEITAFALEHEFVKQVHGFYFLKDESAIRFDAVISFDAPSRNAVYSELLKDLKEKYPGLEFTIAMDTDYGELTE